MKPVPVAVVIPAWKPAAALSALVSELAGRVDQIVIVDDGSGPHSAAVFDECRRRCGVTVLTHPVNRGKGAALKTGFQYVVTHWTSLAGVVTADADGQHASEDVLRVAAELQAHPGSVCLGVRQFTGDVPWRSRAGNSFARLMSRFVLGARIQDTQTGLRGIPAAFLKQLIALRPNRYEFEMATILKARHARLPIREVPIETIYLDDNSSSHFRPLRDGFRVALVLLRFALASLATAIIDNSIFVAAILAGLPLISALISARLVAGTFNYWALRRAVFLADAPHRLILGRYLATVIAITLLSRLLADWFMRQFGLGVMSSKLAAEGALFLVTFIVQRDFVFVEAEGGRTDWDIYYRSTPWTARLTRLYTTRALQQSMADVKAATVLELGGANSCFAEPILKTLHPSAYHVADNNRYGLELLKARYADDRRLHTHAVDLSVEALPVRADLVFSVGLIEHFDRAGTRAMIERHFELARPGGRVVVAFPTPTWLYRITKGFLEWANLWAFPDERPLKVDEVLAACERLGEVTSNRILWPLLLTQRLVAIKVPAESRGGL